MGSRAGPGELLVSRYNFQVPLAHGSLLYNASSGAVVRFAGPDAAGLARLLADPPALFPSATLDDTTLKRLRRGGFLVPVDTDELDVIRERYQRARGDAPIVFTITTTMDCNLGCYYCYETRAKHKLGVTDIDAIVALARQRLEVSGKRSFHADWYGGEPLMNHEFLAGASSALQALCRDKGVRYSASVVSNGTCWPKDVANFVAEHKVRQVQISFDGLRRNHNKRRRYRNGYQGVNQVSSFDQAVTLVDKLVRCTRVDLRYNIDRHNACDLVPFIRFARQRDWFDAEHPLVFQPARLASYSQRSAFMRAWELPIAEFDVLREMVRQEIAADTPIEESEVPDGFPYPRTSVCAALADDSMVIGAEGAMYRCGVQVGEADRQTGSIRQASLGDIPVRSANGTPDDTAWWQGFDPTTLPNCSRCSFLPICWGGCPEKHLTGDRHALDEQSVYWRTNLARLIATGVGETLPAPYEYADSDQFRRIGHSMTHTN